MEASWPVLIGAWLSKVPPTGWRTIENTHHSSIMNNLKVGLKFALLVRPRTQEVGRLPVMVVVQFGFEAVVRGLGEHTLLLQDGQNTHGLKNMLINMWLYLWPCRIIHCDLTSLVPRPSNKTDPYDVKYFHFKKKWSNSSKNTQTHPFYEVNAGL